MSNLFSTKRKEGGKEGGREGRREAAITGDIAPLL